MPKKKSLVKSLRKNKAFIFSTILTIVLFLFGYYYPNVIIEKIMEYRTAYVMEPLTQTITVTSTVSVTVTRANGTVENFSPK